MAQIYSVLRTEEKTDGYREDIQSKLSGITADFAVLAAVEDVFPEAICGWPGALRRRNSWMR